MAKLVTRVNFYKDVAKRATAKVKRTWENTVPNLKAQMQQVKADTVVLNAQRAIELIKSGTSKMGHATGAKLVQNQEELEAMFEEAYQAMQRPSSP